MRLSINGWHPVASHLTCLILGIAMTNTVAHSGASTPVRGEELSFTLDPRLFQTGRDWQPADGAKFYLLKEEKKRLTCRFFRSPLQIDAQPDRFIFSTKLVDQIGLSLLTQELQRKAVVHIKDVSPELQRIPLCRAKPRVSYGG